MREMNEIRGNVRAMISTLSIECRVSVRLVSVYSYFVLHFNLPTSSFIKILNNEINYRFPFL